MIALDASALLAYLFRERGHEEVAPLLDEACISTVNYAEVLSRFVRDGIDILDLTGPLSRQLEVVPFDESQAVRAATLLPFCAPLGLSLADRACLALAAVRSIPVYTADRVWAKLDIGIDIRLIR